MVIAYSTRAWLYFVPIGPSVLVAAFDLYYLIGNRTLRSALNNHVIILLLCYGIVETITDITWQAYYYYTGFALSATNTFCQVWVIFASVLYITIYFLMAWASIERHILVFYPNLFRGRIKRICFHYIPLAACMLYPLVFYSVIFFIVPCNIGFNYNRRFCSRYSCILMVPWIALWDSIGNYILPAFTTVTFSITLFVRVIYRRYLARGQIDWRNYKKMTSQILPISLLYIILQFPPMILYAAYSAGLPWYIAYSYYVDTIFFTYWVVLLTPFASVASLPGLKTKCLNLLFWRKNNAVQPAATEVPRSNVKQPAVIEMNHQRMNQPETAKMPVENASEPTAIKMPHQNVHQSLEGTTINGHFDQPGKVLPDVQ